METNEPSLLTMIIIGIVMVGTVCGGFSWLFFYQMPKIDREREEQAKKLAS